LRKAKSKTVRLAGSHVISTCATLAALLMFVALGSQVVPSALQGTALPGSGGALKIAFLLNIAIILFGWRRSKDLKEALDAFEAAERQAQRNANTDPGTGLANRRELMRSVSEALESGVGGQFLVLDLDHFKRLNDLYGHLAGDKVLLRVAEAMQKFAPDGACCARTGGDEFALLMPQIDEEIAEKVAEKIRSSLATPMFLEGAQVHVTASIGLARLPTCDDEEEVLRHSDVALYAAKRNGRNAVAWFDEELARELSERLKLEEDIRRGIKSGEFIPFFQPLVDLQTRQIVGFEALARWRSPTRGLVEAEGFIDTAERTGLIGPLTLSVLDAALREARDWPAHIKLAVNVSPVQFRDPTLAEQILRILALSGFPASLR